MQFNTQKFLVTGGAGFIGSHLVERLLDLGATEVRILDNLRYGNVNNICKNTNAVVHQYDLANITDQELDKCLKDVDYVFHLAAEKHNQSIDSPARVMKVNIEGMHRLLDAAVRNSIKKVVFTSSLYAYGTISKPAMKETQYPEPWTIYGISKLAGENLLKHFERLNGLASTTLRLFFTYGPKQFAGMGYKSVIMSNFERILNNEAPTIYGDGDQVLDYIFVDDVVNALIEALSPQYNGKLFNIGSGNATNINDLTKLMLKVSGSKLTPVYTKPDWTAGTYRVADTTYTSDNLNWETKISLEQGVQKVYNWMESNKIK